MTRSAVPILMYHDIARDAPATFRKYVVSPQAFRSQMRWLAMAGYNTIGLDLLLGAKEARAALPDRPVVITFDDGFTSAVENAVPVLQAHGFTATFYLVAGLMGKSSRWLGTDPGMSRPMLDWEGARGLRALGFTCGSHTVTHPKLTQLDPASRLEELTRSRKILQDGLGDSVDHFAYPYGDHDGSVRDEVERCGYRSAVSVKIGLSEGDDDLYALHRVPISGTETLLDFISRVRTAASVRQRLHRTRSRLRSWISGAPSG
jgi:peptidoglycan/xylan/chitin deacetylase (PgdA/CDA1 family)